MKTSASVVHYLCLVLADRVMGAVARLLPQAWSDMALRNVLADLLRGVRRIQQPMALATAFDGAEVIDDICRDLIKRIDALLLKHSPGKGRYTEVACFGYRVKVAGDAYTGGTDDAADLRRCCDDMKRAIRAAYALADQGGRNFNARTGLLKVFMAPEFFFRGANGAHSHAVSRCAARTRLTA